MQKDIYEYLKEIGVLKTESGACLNADCPFGGKTALHRAHHRYTIDGETHGTCSNPCTAKVDSAVREAVFMPPRERTAALEARAK